MSRRGEEEVGGWEGRHFNIRLNTPLVIQQRGLQFLRPRYPRWGLGGGGGKKHTKTKTKMEKRGTNTTCQLNCPESSWTSLDRKKKRKKKLSPKRLENNQGRNKLEPLHSFLFAQCQDRLHQQVLSGPPSPWPMFGEIYSPASLGSDLCAKAAMAFFVIFFGPLRS